MKTLPRLVAEYTSDNPTDHQVTVEMVGKETDLVFLWLALSINLIKELKRSPKVFAMLLLTQTPADIRGFTNRRITVDLTHLDRDK